MPGPRAPEIDYGRAFRLAPVGLAVGRDRTIVDCNLAFADLFRGERRTLVGQSFAALYPDERHYLSTGARAERALRARETFANDRVMRRLDGELFWVHVRGRALRPDAPHRDTLWVFTEMSGAHAARNAPSAALTARERDVATMFVDGRTAKEAALALGISPRTVDIYRSRLLRKFGVASTRELVTRLLSG
ncbi:PAS and helix-turn-helix domain-containing protein [Phenylobacterium sp.]|uniref:PAS and helix-turn-helix domain-containing protein n=1 Tax=Phenylobacterium sp. TaxID=1871053 RepID=UPI00301BC2AA